MPRETVAVLAADGKKRVGILATDGTVQTGIYQRECAARGIEAVAPPADVQKLVMSIIYDEIKRGEKGSREKFAAIDRWLRAYPGLYRAVRLPHLPRPARLLSGRHGNPGGKVYHRLRL